MPTVDDGAYFAPTRVRSARRPRILASIVVLAVVALIAVGALDRLSAPSRASMAAATSAPDARLRGQAARSGSGADDAVFQLDVRRSGSYLFVHGDVFSLSVARVSVTLEDPVGHVEATTAVDVPGGSTAFRLGAVPRFVVHFPLTDQVRNGGFLVSATVFDASGQKLATLSQPIDGADTSRRFDPAFPNLIITEASQNGPISVLAKRRPGMVTVYGAVNLQQVARIMVTMQSLDGLPAGSTSALVPESSGDGKDHLPPLGFNLQLAVPAGLVDRILVVQTSAYDKGGRLLATTRSQLAPEQ